jgi:regulator of RNase E activity RraA
MARKALDLARPEDIIVVNASASPITVVMGDMVASKAKQLSIPAFVIDCPILDLPAVQEIGLPVNARERTPIGLLHRGPGDTNFPSIAAASWWCRRHHCWRQGRSGGRSGELRRVGYPAA